MVVQISVDVTTKCNQSFYRTGIVRVERKVSHVIDILFNIVLRFRGQIVYGVAIVVLGTQIPPELTQRIVFVKISHHRDSVCDITHVQVVAVLRESIRHD